MLNLLFVGDIHLGRLPRLPAELGIEPAELAPTKAWHNTAEWALQNKVDAVILAGDVVESLEDRFEAFGHLEKQIRNMTGAGIKVVGVAGNHDGKALPQLVDRIPEFKLLGRDGQWERFKICGESDEVVDLLGWSFPQQHVSANPIDDLDLKPRDGIVTLGVLHCDLDASSSNYAPVPKAQLEAIGCDAWFLGHVHKPSELKLPHPIGYLGSLVGLKPGVGERGLHGPWHVRVSSTGIESIEQVPLAPLRWEAESLDVAELEIPDGTDPDDAIARGLATAIDRIHKRIGASIGKLEAVGCRVIFTGRSNTFSKLRGQAEGTGAQKQILDRSNVPYFIEKIIDETAPEIDLDDLARSEGPPGILAGKLKDLEENGAAADELVHAATRELATAVRTVIPVGANDPDPADVRNTLLRAGYKALDALLAQQQPGGADA